MRAILQIVSSVEVETDGKPVGKIGKGLLVYVGVAAGDDESEARRVARKVAKLRIFADEHGKLNLSVRDVRGGVLAVSNFTLLADTRKGRRPTFTDAASVQQARRLYEIFVEELKECGCEVACGQFAAKMKIRSVAEGPVNVIVD